MRCYSYRLFYINASLLVLHKHNQEQLFGTKKGFSSFHVLDDKLKLDKNINL